MGQFTASCSELLSFPIIDPAGKRIGQIIDIRSEGENPRLRAFEVYLDAQPSGLRTVSWHDAIISYNHRWVMINPDTLFPVPFR